MHYTPQSELEARLLRVQAKLRNTELDGILVFQKADLFYLTGTVQNGFFFVPLEGQPVFAVRRSLRRAHASKKRSNG